MTKWGILGAGIIANCFARDFHRVKGAKLTAVAARDKDRACAFAQKYGIEQAYGSYLDLVENPDIDVVYIATTHNFHVEHVKLCLEHGKNVLCEKPATVNRKEFDEISALAREKHLFLMEALWTAFLPSILHAQKWIEAGYIGQVTTIMADLGFVLDLTPGGRNINPDLAAGTMLDLMIYPLSFGRIFSNSHVTDYQIMADMHPTGVDKNDFVQLRYENGIIGQFSASNCERFHNDGIIIGTKGRIVVGDFHMSKTARLIAEEFEESFHDKLDDVMGYNYEAQHVTDCINAGLTESPIMPLSVTADIMSLMDDMRERIGVKYPFEKRFATTPYASNDFSVD